MAKADAVICSKVPRAVVQRLRAVADENDRTLSGQVRAVLRAWCEQQQAGGQPPAAR